MSRCSTSAFFHNSLDAIANVRSTDECSGISWALGHRRSVKTGKGKSRGGNFSRTITIPHPPVNKLPLQHGHKSRKFQTTQARKKRKGTKQNKRMPLRAIKEAQEASLSRRLRSENQRRCTIKSFPSLSPLGYEKEARPQCSVPFQSRRTLR